MGWPVLLVVGCSWASNFAGFALDLRAMIEQTTTLNVASGCSVSIAVERSFLGQSVNAWMSDMEHVRDPYVDMTALQANF